jgi:hypothetical protein
MFQINLVPEVQEKKLQVKKVNTYSTIFAIALLGVIAASLLIIGGIDIAKKAEISSTDKKIADVNTESEKYKELEETVISLEKGLAGVKKVTDGTNNWTKLLPHLEASTPTDVKYVNLKISSGALEGTLEGKSVDSLAKLVESYKRYQVIVLSGPGVEGGSVNVSIDSGTATAVNVKSNGLWVYAINIDPDADHEIKVDTSGSDAITIKYTAKDKKIVSTDAAVTAQAKKLFSNVEAKQYQKKDTGISFDLKLNFDVSTLW